MTSSLHKLTMAEWRAVLQLHGDGTCVVLVDDGGELRPPRTPAELRSRGCRCIVCGRRPTADDLAEVVAAPRSTP